MIFPFSSIVPTLESLTQSVRQAFVGQLPGADAWIPLNNVGPTAKVVAGALWGLCGKLAFVFQQIFVGTAQGKYLELHAADYGMSRRAAVAATGLVDITVTAAATFPAGTQFQRGDGVIYVASVQTVFSGAGTLSVSVTDATPEALGNAIGGTPLEILSASGAVPSGPGAATALAVVDSGTPITGGLDVEADGAFWTTDLSTLRGRVLFRKRNPPQGGSAADYVEWATDVSGVTRVFVERLYAGAGTLRVFPLMDGIFAANGGIPDAGHIDAVANAIYAAMPAEAAVAIVAATPVAINVTVSNLNPNTSAAQAAVQAELQAAIVRLGRVAGNDSGAGGMPFLATPASFYAAWISDAVIEAAGVISADVSPTTDISLTAGQAPVLGTITWA